MRCEKIPFRGGAAIVCGRRSRKPISADEQATMREVFEMADAENRMIDDQQKFLARCRAARDRCQAMADEADKLHLPILAREWDHLGKELDNAIGLQLRAFRDDTLATDERLGIQQEHQS